MAKKLTYRQISEKAQVSVMTVSNTIRGTRKVNPKTREKVENAIRELGGALPLEQDRSRQKAITVKHRPFRRLRLLSRGHHVKAHRNARIFSSLYESLMYEAAKADYELACHYFDENPKIDLERLTNQTDALLVFGLGWDELDEQPKIPTISLMSTQIWFADDHVGYNTLRVSELAARFLISQKCKSIAYLGADGANRCSAFRDYVLEHSKAKFKEHIIQDAYIYDPAMRINYAKILAVVRRMKDSGKPPDGIFAYDDTTALAIKDALYSVGLGSRNIHLVGCNNDPGAIDILGQHAATVDIGTEEVARIGVSRALECINNPRSKGQSILVEPRLILPTGPVKRGELMRTTK